MSEKLTLLWFYSPDCEYCTEIEDEVKRFAESQEAYLVTYQRDILDDWGALQVPALMFNHPSVENHVFIGRFCLDALRYMLANG